MDNITPASTKSDIIDGALELIDTQAAQLANLKQQQTGNSIGPWGIISDGSSDSTIHFFPTYFLGCLVPARSSCQALEIQEKILLGL